MQPIFTRVEEVIIWLGCNLKKPRNCKDLVKFFNKEYWNRVWIVQEITVAQLLRILLGNITSIPQEILEERLTDHLNAESGQDDPCWVIHRLQKILFRLSSQRRLSLLDLRHRTDNSHLSGCYIKKIDLSPGLITRTASVCMICSRNSYFLYQNGWRLADHLPARSDGPWLDGRFPSWVPLWLYNYKRRPRAALTCLKSLMELDENRIFRSANTRPRVEVEGKRRCVYA
jgi:hypothetical protein